MEKSVLFLGQFLVPNIQMINWLGSVLMKSQNQFPSKKLCAPRYPWKPKETVTQGSPLEIKQELNALLQAETIWLHSTHFSTIAVNLTLRLHFVTGDSALHKWQKLPVAGWKGKPWSRNILFPFNFCMVNNNWENKLIAWAEGLNW